MIEQTQYTQSEVQALLQSVGCNLRNARIGSAIAVCESPVFGADEPTSDFTAVGDQELANDVWGYSYGGFQIRSLRAETGTGGWRDKDRLLVPRFNARAARAIKLGSGWSAWSTFKSGMYKAYLQDLFPPPSGTYQVLAGDSLSSSIRTSITKLVEQQIWQHLH